MALTINLLAPTIEKVVSKLKASHLDLLRLFRLDFAAYRVPEAALAPLRREEAAAEARDGAWFNEAAHFQAAVADAFQARDAVLHWMVEAEELKAPWPQGAARLGTRAGTAAIATCRQNGAPLSARKQARKNAKCYF